MTMFLRAMRSADIPEVMAIASAEPNAAQWTEAAYVSLLARAEKNEAIVPVAEFNKTLLGFLAAQSAGLDWELENIVVRETARRQGTATALFSELLGELRRHKVELLMLEVRASNFSAREFYDQNGFMQIALRRDYYRDPLEDAVLYALHL